MGTSIKVWWRKVLAWLRGGDGGTGGGGAGATVRPLPSIGGGGTLTGYGRANYWAAAGKEELRRDVEACAAAGVAIYTIELAGWAETSVFGDAKRLADAQALYEWLVGQCRALGLWLLVSIANDNAGSGKYGDRRIGLGRATADLHALAECVRKCGPENVLVQPVAETRTDAGRAFEAHCVALLKGFALVNNAGSRPTGAGAMKHFAWHPFKVADIAGAPEGAFVVSDTGSIVLELGGRSLDGPGNATALKRFVAAVKARGCPAAVYYAFKRRAHDAAAIKALGAG